MNQNDEHIASIIGNRAKIAQRKEELRDVAVACKITWCILCYTRVIKS